MKTIAAIFLLSCCAFGQDKATVSANGSWLRTAGREIRSEVR